MCDCYFVINVFVPVKEISGCLISFIISFRIWNCCIEKKSNKNQEIFFLLGLKYWWNVTMFTWRKIEIKFYVWGVCSSKIVIKFCPLLDFTAGVACLGQRLWFAEDGEEAISLPNRSHHSLYMLLDLYTLKLNTVNIS